MIKGKDLEELKVPKVAEIRAKLYEALGKSYAAGKKDSELKPLVGKLAVSANPTEVLEQVDIPKVQSCSRRTGEIPKWPNRLQREERKGTLEVVGHRKGRSQSA